MTAPTTSPGTAVATQPKGALARLLESDNARARIEPFLPEGVKVARVIAGVQLAAMQNAQIAQCTPESIVLAVARILSWGLEIGTTAHIVPFGKVATPVADYKGLIELMVGSGCIRHAEGHAVFAGDQFTYELGLAPALTHKRSSFKERGKVVAAYVVLHLAGGRKVFDVMDIGEIDAIRNTHSKQWNESKAGACPPWYAVKCVFRRISKTVPKNPRLAKVLAVFEEDELAELGEEVASIEAPAAGRLIGAGEDFGTPGDAAAPDMPVCCACFEVRVEGEGMVCPGCAEESEKVSAKSGPSGELPLGDAAKPKGTNAVRAGR